MRTLLVSAFLALSIPASGSANAGPGEQLVESAMVKVTVQDGDVTVRHPGQECDHGAEYEIFMKQGKAKYVVTVVIDKGEDDKYQVQIGYKRNGKSMVSGSVAVAAKATGSIAKGNQKVSVMVDPAGTVDGRDKIEGPDGDDPLDGVPGKKKKK